MGEEEAKRFAKLFLNEASLAGKLNHPNIVGVYDAVVEGDQRYIVMEYVTGGSLKKFCTETNLLPLRQAVLVIFKMCRALDYAFQNGVIHRDIKPANILLSERDDIKVSDFGTAKISQSEHTQIDGFLGSPAYMSPEQINKLRSLPFFREFKDAELWEVLRGAVWETRSRDENLLLEGEIGQAFFIIVGGQVKVVKDAKLLNVLKEGDCFGEMAYLSGADSARRSASIISVSEVQLLKVQSTQLESLSEGCQLRFNREFLRTLIERLTWTSSVLAQVRR